MIDNKEDLSFRILYKDNSLVKTRYNLTLVENRLYNLIMHKFQTHGENYECTLTLKEIKEVIKHKGEVNYKVAEGAIEKLFNSCIEIEELKDNGIHKIYHKYRFINGYTYDNELEIFTIKATEKIYKLLKKKFDCGGYTNLNLTVFLNLRNYYAQRLYDLLRLWSNSKNTINYKIEDLKLYFKLEGMYNEYGNFKRRVIIPAIKDLNKSGMFQIEIKERKVGRKVESIDFIVKDLDRNTAKRNKAIEIEPIIATDQITDEIKIDALDINKQNKDKIFNLFNKDNNKDNSDIPILKYKNKKSQKCKHDYLEQILSRNKSSQI